MGATDDQKRRDATGAQPASDSANGAAHRVVLDGRYRLENVIGRGAMGTVYHATQIGLRRRVAVKILRSDLSQSRKALAKFRREARLSARLSHPNIVTVHDFETLPTGEAFIVMEYLPGPTLEQWIVGNDPTPVETTAASLGAVCSAISALHRAGVIHCDIKPTNVVLPVDESAGDVVKVVDFGLVRLGGDHASSASEDGLVVGSPEYMAPELFHGARPNVATDVYALGVTAFEALTRAKPFAGRSLRELLDQHSNPERPSASAVRPDLPATLDAVLARAIAVDPADRFDSVDTFAAALAHALARCPAPSEDLEARPTVSDAPRRHSVLLVEDDEDLRTLLGCFLEQHDFEVTAVSDGVDALLQIGGHPFDVIVTDLNMPNLDGITLVRMLSQKRVETPVVFLSASTDERDEAQALELGAAAFLRKPPRLDQVLDTITQAIESAARRRTP